MATEAFVASTEDAGLPAVGALVIHAVTDASDGVRALTLRSQLEQALPAWEPGAHIDIFVPGFGPRQYSLCGDPADREVWTVAVQRERGGRGGSEWLHRASPGTVLTVGGPRNHFPLVDASRYRFIAGGIGVTPLLPMIKSLSPAKEWSLLYGGRSLSTMAFSEELRAYGGERVLLWPQDRCGIPNIAQFVETIGPDAVVYACGPSPMLREVERQAEGWPSGVLHIERFAPRESVQSASSAFDLVLARSNRKLRVEANESIVEALSRVGVKVPTVCKEGVCGTCETKVLEGTPDHRDSVLSEEERVASKTMMVCCSRALTSRLVLDL